ncbi:hypothetical protein ACRYCC_11470 [Actinomadura scrupuli]|uniref:hypothetical protein n=1 Tax=Actinomadura scrupuli TaxID=559629 RepID=UPI003D989424
MIARHEGRTAHDTAADDCAEGFLGELDEILWVLQDIQRAEDNHFRQATRKTDHIVELRRLLYRLHRVLTGWEEAAATEGGARTDPAAGPAPGPETEPDAGPEAWPEAGPETGGEAGGRPTGGSGTG